MNQRHREWSRYSAGEYHDNSERVGLRDEHFVPTVRARWQVRLAGLRLLLSQE
jgi:hypothetical protein